MSYFWSKETGSFYVDGIHSDMPSDVVPITDEQHQQLINANSLGKVITAGKDGIPEAVDPPALTSEELAAEHRAKRNNLLAETDWWAVQDRIMSQAEIDYRQALRDITDQPTFPDSVVWPEM